MFFCYFFGVKLGFMVKVAIEWLVILFDLFLEVGKDNEK